MTQTPLRVLVVDDDPEDLEIIDDLLQEGGPGSYVVRAATTFEQGLQALTDDEPDICLVDYQLGARSGVEFIREAVARAPAVPDVLLTGAGSAAVDRSAMQAGAVDYLPKSELTADRLERTIRYAVERARLGRRLLRTFAALDEAVLVMRGDTVVDANPAAERILGLDLDELVGSTTEKLHVDRATFEQYSAVAVPALERDGVFRGSYPMRRSDGLVFEAEQTVSLLDPEEGLAGGVVSVIRDVSERVRAEAALRTSEERFRQIAESIHDVFWVRAPDLSRLEYVSPAFANIWGRPVDGLLEDSSLWLETVLPSDRQRLRDALEVEQPVGHELEYRIVRPDGEIRWIFDRAFPVREDGEVVRIIGVAEDITDRKLAEERFAVLSQEVADGIHVIAPDGRILFATPAAAAVLGYSSEELEGRNALDLAHPEDRSEIRDMLREVVHQPGGVARRQYRGMTRDNEVRYLESVGRNRIDHPAIGGVVVTTRDVTERYHLEEQLRQSQKMEAVGRLAGGIAHDFNNLLTVIRSQTDLMLIDMQEGGVPEPATLETELQIVQAAADRAASLTSQLLAFSREQILQPRVVDLSEVVLDMARLLERLIGEDVSIQRDLETALPSVRVDPGQLEQAVMNLAVNARDAMPNGGRLTLRTRRQRLRGGEAAASAGQEAGEYVVLEVSDTGTGMDAETQSHVFEPFYTTKEKGKGTGLGLAMVYGVVTQSGGMVRLESEPGRGSTFGLCFPAVDERPDRRKPTVRAAGALGAMPRHILLVEDDDAVRRVAIRILERAGVDVVAVGTAEEGLDALSREHAFDVLLTDLVLPGKSGRALVDHLQANGSRLPVIVMSGYAEDSPGERGDLPEDVAFLQKPFTPKELVQVVREVLSQAVEAGVHS